MGGMRPVPPNIVYCGMMQCRQARPLTGDLKQFMDSATEGVLYVPCGSVLEGSQGLGCQNVSILHLFVSFEVTFCLLCWFILCWLRSSKLSQGEPPSQASNKKLSGESWPQASNTNVTKFRRLADALSYVGRRYRLIQKC